MPEQFELIPIEKAMAGLKIAATAYLERTRNLCAAFFNDRVTLDACVNIADVQ